MTYLLATGPNRDVPFQKPTPVNLIWGHLNFWVISVDLGRFTLPVSVHEEAFSLLEI